jgi:hypothetical protein
VLVYLDSAHLALLERSSTQDADAFLSVFREHGCELALSLHHLQEIAQLSDRASVERRMRVLESFPSIRCKPAGVDLVTRLEIHFQLLTSMGFAPQVRRSVLDTLFPPAAVEDLRAAIIRFQPLFKMARRAHELGAEASNLAKAAAKVGSVSTRRDVNLGNHDSLEVATAFESSLTDLPGYVQRLARTWHGWVRAAISEHRTIRRALISIYRLGEAAIVDRIPDSDLAMASVFFDVGRSEAKELLRKMSGDLPSPAQLFSRLDPYAAPGFALQLAVQRARKRRPEEDMAGDEIDAAHVAFAPYVDVLFVDKRTRAFIEQEGRDNPMLLSPEAAGWISQAGTLERAAAAIAERSAFIHAE